MVDGNIRAQGSVQEIKNQFGDKYEIEVKFHFKEDNIKFEEEINEKNILNFLEFKSKEQE